MIKGSKHTKESRENLRTSHLGHIHSEEHKRKIGLASKGRMPVNIEQLKIINLGRKHTEEQNRNHAKVMTGRISVLKGKKRPNLSGINNYRWIKDRTKLKRYADAARDRRSSAYRFWSQSIKNRDGWKCKMCDSKEHLIAHHILGYKNYPELRYDINNGITLCHAHHPRKKVEEAKLLPYFQSLVAEMK